MTLAEQIRTLAAQLAPETIANRRALHANPELSFQEYNTAAYIKAALDTMSIPWQAIGNTGVVAHIKGDKIQHSDKAIALRADIDALPITELNDLPFGSNNNGVMHACGHDAHTASLLGTAKILQTLRSQFGGTIKLVFQPGEEKLPGGASILIKEGVLQNPRPDRMIGQHVLPTIQSGKIGIRKGPMMASMDEITVTVKGKGGHGAMPHQNIDPVTIACQIVIGLQQIVSRFSNPIIPSVLSFGKLIANGAINIIPDEVYMEGTFRTIDETWRQKAHQQMIKTATGIAEAFGATCEFNINVGYPVLINDPAFTSDIERYATEYLGAENIEYPDLWMAAEDFAYYGREVSACFYLLGTNNASGDKGHPLHNPRFDIEEDTLSLSPGLMAWFAIRSLEDATQH